MDNPPSVESWERAGGRPVAHRSADGAVLRAASPAGARAAGDPQVRRRWSSLQLLGDQHEIEIAHADSVYRLRITSLGKLILTK